VRPIGAALLAWTTFGEGDPALKTAVVILCGGIALTSHASKAATRLAINHSPEPISNIVTSFAEDLFAPLGVWLSLKHPIFVLVLVLMFLAAFVWLSPRVFRLVRLQLIALSSWIAGSPRAAGSSASVPGTLNAQAVQALSTLASCARPLPDGYADAVTSASDRLDSLTGIRCAATKQVKGLKNSVGYFVISSEELVFVARRFFRYRIHRTSTGDVLSAELKRGILLNQLILHTAGDEVSFYVFKNAGNS
jgi:hypothetical protein